MGRMQLTSQQAGQEKKTKHKDTVTVFFCAIRSLCIMIGRAWLHLDLRPRLVVAVSASRSAQSVTAELAQVNFHYKPLQKFLLFSFFPAHFFLHCNPLSSFFESGVFFFWIKARLYDQRTGPFKVISIFATLLYIPTIFSGGHQTHSLQAITVSAAPFYQRITSCLHSLVCSVLRYGFIASRPSISGTVGHLSRPVVGLGPFFGAAWLRYLSAPGRLCISIFHTDTVDGICFFGNSDGCS